MKIGLVLSGGGSNGSYQMGVIKALEELNIKCDIVTGTSIGSMNGAMYVSNSLDKAEEVWNNLNFNNIFSEEIKYETEKDAIEVIKKYLKAIPKGGMDTSNLKKNLIANVDLDKFYNSKIDYGLTTVSFPSLKLVKLTKEEIKREELYDYIIASATAFPVFKLKTIKNKKYIDGGIRDIIPYDLAIKLGAEKLIVVNASSFYRHAKLPKKIIKKYDAKMITPRNKTGRSLVFDSKQSKKNILYGYNDAMKTFGYLDGNKYTFRNISKEVEQYNFKNKNEYIKLLESTGRIFKLDDSRIYTTNEFIKIINNKMDKIVLKKVKRIQDIKNLLNPQERIKYIYEKIQNEENRSLVLLNTLLPKEYNIAMYMYKKNILSKK